MAQTDYEDSDSNQPSDSDGSEESNDSKEEEEEQIQTGLTQRGATIATGSVVASTGTGASMETLLQGPNVQLGMTLLEQQFNAGGDPNIIQWWDILNNQMTTGQQTQQISQGGQLLGQTQHPPAQSHNFSETTQQPKEKSSQKILKSYLKNITLEETREGLLPAFLLIGSKEETPTEKAYLKSMIVAGTDPVMHVHMSPGNPCMEIIHSIFHYVTGIGTNDKHHRKMVGFIGDRVGTIDPPCVLIQKNHW